MYPKSTARYEPDEYHIPARDHDQPIDRLAEADDTFDTLRNVLAQTPLEGDDVENGEGEECETDNETDGGVQGEDGTGLAVAQRESI
jgi:hypothetical protein